MVLLCRIAWDVALGRCGADASDALLLQHVKKAEQPCWLHVAQYVVVHAGSVLLPVEFGLCHKLVLLACCAAPPTQHSKQHCCLLCLARIMCCTQHAYVGSCCFCLPA